MSCSIYTCNRNYCVGVYSLINNGKILLSGWNSQNYSNWPRAHFITLELITTKIDLFYEVLVVLKKTDCLMSGTNVV